ncbi:UBX domain-containing protein 6-like [Anneissia japonica]|uniref:UBX domain-containing protein 6-like n=1 Tax=Anneissia japonica TaxID=1529436 RepID=UPI0014257D49|nr:UBX domain-containing protein 6-like [Anneissia japonica]
MKKIGQFFEQKKLDHKFKKAGEGHKLTDERPASSASSSNAGTSRPQTATRQISSEGAQMAGMAAVARSEPPKTESQQMKAIRREAQRQIEKEQAEKAVNIPTAASARTSSSQGSNDPDGFNDGSAPVSVGGVYYTCALSPERVQKSELDEHIRECILMHLAVDPIKASSMMVKTLNKDSEKVQVCINTIEKYISNVCAHPDEDKYCKIRLGNKAFQERVGSIEGAEEFLQALGFERKLLQQNGQEESYLVLQQEKRNNPEQLKALFDVLVNTQPVKPILDRDIKVFHPHNCVMRFNLPPEFYNLSTQEVEREQQLRAEEVEKNSILRTKAMREADLQKQLRRYRYALIRVRFPDGIILQGTFYARDKLSSLMQFVRECLVNDWQPFYLVTQTRQKLTEENSMLTELQIAPAAMLNFAWDESIAEDIASAQVQQTAILKPAIMKLIQPL